jgi:transposase
MIGMNSDIISAKNSNFCGELMLTPDVVDNILSLHRLGWGKKKIAKELAISSRTVKRYLAQNGWQPYKKPKRQKKLEGLESWLEHTFYLHKGNAAVVHQELIRQHQITVNPSTVERAVKPFRHKLVSEAIATVRFETPPGKQMQIDFGTMTLKIAGEERRVHFFAAVLGYSRRQYVQAFPHQRQTAWFEGMEGAFRHFDGIPEQILLDNAKALVSNHNPLTREVIFNDKLRTFASYWKFTPKACAPYRARTKGKDENTVKYLKKNAIAGREFSSWEHLEEHLMWWMKEVSDVRIHGTTGEKPIDRFLNDESFRLQPKKGKPPFYQIRELKRVVQADACVEVDTNFYSVPWKWIKKPVIVQVMDQEVKIFHGSEELASHSISFGRRERLIDPNHLEGVIGVNWLNHKEDQSDSIITKKTEQAEFLRPLSDYEAVIGGGW